MEGQAELLRLWGSEGPGLRSYFRRALDADAAEDLTAETFVQLAAAYDRGSVTNGAAVLRSIAQRRLVDEIRHRQRVTPAGFLTEDDERIDDLVMPVVVPLSAATAEFRERFDAAVRQLPEPERDAFILTELRGLGDREAAPYLGVSHMTVHTRRKAATDMVRRALAGR